MTIPITPEIANKTAIHLNNLKIQKDNSIIIDVVNKLLSERYLNSIIGCSISHDEIVKLVKDIDPNISEDQCYNVPSIYSDYKWNVTYNKSTPRVYTFKEKTN